MTTSLEIGGYLARLRNKAGMTQADLAKKLTFSAAVVSRMETGERAVSPDELETILKAIGTEDVLGCLETINRVWLNLPRPSLGYREEPILWEAEKASQRIKALRADPTVPHPFANRLDETLNEINGSAELVLSNEFVIAFVGNIGVGKSTAICRITDLEVSENTAGQPVTVLDVGAGGVTLCEVQIARGPGYGISVEPKTEEEFYREIREFARSFMPSPDTDVAEGEAEPGFSGTSREFDRAIRNMSGLTIRRTRLPDGTRERTDPIHSMAQNCANLDDLALAIRAKMNLHKRTRRELWYPELASKEPLSWLAEVFRQVNNGRNPDFSLPKRIEVMVPQPILDTASEDALSLRLVDTKGIDDTAERGDLEAYFSNPNSLVVMCSTFNEAPSTLAQQLLDRAAKGGFSNVANKSAVLVLPRPSEALAVRDDEGFAVDTVTDGYELKGEQVANTLRNQELPAVPIEFFNSLEDDPQQLTDFLLGLVKHLRDMNVAQLREVIDGAIALVENHENEQVRAVQQQVSRQLEAWVQLNREIAPFQREPEARLLMAIAMMRYASTLQASVRRGGAWYNLDYAHQLGYGTRAMVAMATNAKIEGFRGLADTLLNTADWAEASDLVRQAIRIIESGVASLLNDSDQLGKTIYTEHMEDDGELWDLCAREWGRGPGYRDRVLRTHRQWFQANREAIDDRVNVTVDAKWHGVLDRLLAILQTD